MTVAIAEEVTFGGSGLDRAAHLRSNSEAMRAAMEATEAQMILFWRGSILVDAEAALVRMSVAASTLIEVGAAAVFLGLDDGTPLFALDLTALAPEQGGFPDPAQAWPTQGFPLSRSLTVDEIFVDLRSVMARLSRQDAELAATAKAVYAWHATHRFCACCGEPSDVIEAGWQRRCPSCGARHFPRTDPVVIMLITRDNQVLLGRSPEWPEGMYSLLAGFVEPGETIEAAVRREVQEETSVPVGAVEYLCCQPWPFPNSLMFGCRGTALSDRIDVDPLEIEAALWVSREELSTVFAGDHPLIRPPRKGAIAEFLLRNWLADRLD
ncbi:NAD(+) diphosphatase [Pseudooceanicola sediminis]|uniref:NAD(+) diphosphatase n=1 Tax=Pseudooceanicola sediminis TaxID=2211117 RepID=A0A399IXH2_9RHOB|nr:NAD(+) diphosphatase [Pseudooceanicola sediminis]KAA2312925.1 NAD(+) diphosphatase [Puniceibacterium sp. HSS470]RII37674.1 NAD(+) diphosphatase [Pseudooceanicola sediminis]|tara:strand:+ start:20249 stop:21220 length:972 start_codon:yes stop_codon:yes gene_type:complete